jgi:hypothetical protein
MHSGLESMHSVAKTVGSVADLIVSVAKTEPPYRVATLLPPIASTAATRDSLLGSSLNTWGGWPGR